MTDPVVWAIDADHLANQLLPRDCPRVCLRNGHQTTTADVDRFLGGDPGRRVIAVESAWMPAVASATLFVYELPPAAFGMEDAAAGYYVARRAVTPIGSEVVTNLPARLAAEGVSLIDRETLWPLRDEAITSSLMFSIMRMRHARPRPISP